jgi:broad specificity phosphatase PhoE
MKIYFTRHGESQANLKREISNRGLRYGLTLKGRQQAAELAQRLEGLSITYIYSSPILRAVETSVILASRLNLDYEVVDALREYDCGIAEGHSGDGAWQMWQELFDAWTKEKQWERRIEGGESFYDVQNRFVPFIEKLVQQYQHTEANILCVGHGGLYWTMLPMVLKNVDNEFIIGHQGFSYATHIVAQLTPGGLFCREWNGVEIDEHGKVFKI